eukprot:gene15922-11393_t
MTWFTRFGGGSSMSSASQVSKASSQPLGAQTSRAQSATKKNQVVAEPPLIATVEDKAHEEVRPALATECLPSLKTGDSGANSPPCRDVPAPSRRSSLAWSGKVMDAASSQKFLQLITGSSKPLVAARDEVLHEFDLLPEHFPEHFVVVEKSGDQAADLVADDVEVGQSNH